MGVIDPKAEKYYSISPYAYVANNPSHYDSLTRKNVYVFVEKMPCYKDGETSFMADFNKFFDYDPSQYSDESVQTTLQVQFVISSSGKLIGARIYNKAMDRLTDFEKAGLKALTSMQGWLLACIMAGQLMCYWRE